MNKGRISALGCGWFSEARPPPTPSLESALGHGCLPRRVCRQVAGESPVLSQAVCPSTAALTSSQSDGSWGGLPRGWKRWTSAGPDSHRLTSLGCQRTSGETPRLDFHPYIQLWFGICLAPSPATTEEERQVRRAAGSSGDDGGVDALKETVRRVRLLTGEAAHRCRS